MFYYRKNFAIVLALLLFYSTRAEKSTSSTCDRKCGGYSVPYPLGFSANCNIKLNCGSKQQMEIGKFQVQKVTSSSIFIDLPAKCNRSVQSIHSLFSKNFAPTKNNSLLVQSCSSAVGGCVIPFTSLMGHQWKLDGCDKNSENISCFTQQLTKNDLDVLTYDDVEGTKCKYLFSAIAVEQGNDPAISLQLQVLQLGWWLEGSCQCSNNANCSIVHFAEGKKGYRCQCAEGYQGDGFKNGTGCRRVSHCRAATLMSGGCGKAAKIGVLAGGIIAVAVFIAAVCLPCYFARRRYTVLRKQMTVKRLLREAAGNSSVPFYPYKEIEKATNFFSEKQRLGTGAFGTVYAGKLHDHEWVAIKKIKYRDTNSVDQVMNEIKLLSSVSHPNLVRLLGCCIEGGEQILVYEFMPNGTLSQHLQRERGAGLPWTIRLTIATETANAIAYLHSAIDPPIYHRDIKSSNILLDYHFKSKVADFGLSRLGMTETSHISTAPQGTPGYVDPQYHQNFHLSDKSDVYSFGVVLVEIITALKVVDFARPHSDVNLAALAVDRIRRDCVDEIVDPFLEPHRDAWTLYSVHKVAELAFRCLAFHSDMRPTMIEVAEELESIRRSAWTTMEETICMASSVGSSCSSFGRIGSDKSCGRMNFKKAARGSERLVVVEQRMDSFQHSVGEVKDSSPVSVHDPWLSGQSSPSTNSLLGNVVH
ncbi:wall-associated receptor kinase-like 14 [Senna tora]|uniref:Wall-associated receptor kinase-like 14 n=1 Tax=Senna tora TaxID=362788 RepID=A0A834SV69_9FABA|nr:wall-associated receptor kinase-like 14 [Senna tora]